MRPALIVGGVAVLGLGAWWLYQRNKQRAQLAARMQAAADAAERRARAQAQLVAWARNPMIRAQVSPAVVLQTEVQAGTYNRATAGNMARGFELNYTAGSV
jgi:hypothetical protein